MTIIRNKNGSEKGKADWYVKILGKHTWEDLMTHFEADLRQFQKNSFEYYAGNG